MLYNLNAQKAIVQSHPSLSLKIHPHTHKRLLLQRNLRIRLTGNTQYITFFNLERLIKGWTDVI